MSARLSLGSALAWALALAAARPSSAAITGLSVQDGANAADWSIQASLQTGSVQYGDRAFTFTAVPAAVNVNARSPY